MGLQEAMTIIQNMQGDRPAQGDVADNTSSPDEQQEDFFESRLNRTLTEDTIEGQIYPTNRIPLLMLQSKPRHCR